MLYFTSHRYREESSRYLAASDSFYSQTDIALQLTIAATIYAMVALIQVRLRISYIPARSLCLQDVTVGPVVAVCFLASGKVDHGSLSVPTMCLLKRSTQRSVASGEPRRLRKAPEWMLWS